MGIVLMMLSVMLLAFRVGSAAVLTQPPITKIEEMGGLVHIRSEISNLKSQRLTTRVSGFGQAHGHCHPSTVSPNSHLNSLADLALIKHAEQII